MVSAAPFVQAAAAALLAALSAWLLAGWARERKEKRHLRRQLEQLAGGRPAATATDQIVLRAGPSGTVWERLGTRLRLLQRVDRLLEQAGTEWRRAHLLRFTAAGALGTAVALLLAGASSLVLLLGIAAGGGLPALWLERARRRRLRLFEQQLPEAIDLLSRAIRAGHAVSTGLRLVAEESPEPLRGEFRRVFDEQRYGLPFEDSFLKLADRVNLMDLRVMIVAILVQREVGGNLAEVLDKIAHLIRTRFALRRQIRVHTAQGRVSAWVLSLLPLVVAGVLFLVSPTYLLTLVDEPLGRMMLGFALLLQFVGYVWVWRIVRVTY